MSMFYTARHAAQRTTRTATQRAGAGVLAATALGLGATTMTVTSAAAQGGPEGATQTQSQSSSSGAQSTSGSTSSNATLEKGDTGSAVEQLQKKLGVSADGTFGSATEQAVKNYQSEKGLTADGVAGPQTQAALDGASASSSTGGGQSAPATGGNTSNVSATSASSSASSTSGIVGTAESLIGSPYVYGGTSPSGFDCSGFVQYVYGQNGKDVPRTTQEQMAAATPVSDPQPGDIVFFGDDAYHNGIYVGDGKIIDAGNSDSPVQERDIWTDDVTYGRF